MYTHRRFFALLLIVAASCTKPAPGATADGATSAPTRVGRDPYSISREELEDPAIATRDAYYAITQLRPSFFRNRGPQTLRGSSTGGVPGAVQVSQDFGPLQAASMLQNTEVRSILEIRYLNANEATARFGINANGGAVIVLLTSKQ